MQDGKNLILAIVLCLLVVVGWSYLGEKMGWAPKPAPAPVEQTQQQAAPQADAQAEQQRKLAEPLPVFKESAGRDMTVSTPLYTAKIYTGGGILRSFELNKFRTSVDENSPRVNLINATTSAMAPLGLLVNGQPSWSTGLWSCEEEGDITVAAGEKRTLRLVGMVGDLRVIRDITFDASTYAITETVAVTPTGTNAASVRLGYTVGADASNAHGGQYDAMRVGWDDNGSLQEETSAEKLATGVMASGTIYWGGAMSTYFLNGMLPGDPNGVTFKGVLQNNVYRAAMELQPQTVAAGSEITTKTTYWFGPKDRTMMGQVSEELAKSVKEANSYVGPMNIVVLVVGLLSSFVGAGASTCVYLRPVFISAMLISGAEVSRVEDSVRRICMAYGAEKVDVFTITSAIVVTVYSPMFGAVTQTRRITSTKYDLFKLARLNALSRRICEEMPASSANFIWSSSLAYSFFSSRAHSRVIARLSFSSSPIYQDSIPALALSLPPRMICECAIELFACFLLRFRVLYWY